MKITVFAKSQKQAQMSHIGGGKRGLWQGGSPPPPGHNINKTTKLTTGLHRGLFVASWFSSTPWPKGRRIFHFLQKHVWPKICRQKCGEKYVDQRIRRQQKIILKAYGLSTDPFVVHVFHFVVLRLSLKTPEVRRRQCFAKILKIEKNLEES